MKSKRVIVRPKRMFRFGLACACSMLLMIVTSSCVSNDIPQSATSLASTGNLPVVSATSKPSKTIEQVTQNWRGSQHLDDIHLSKGLSCQNCHTIWPPKGAPANSDCIDCHAASFPASVSGPRPRGSTPHRSHRGELNCFQCHHSHEASVLYCNKCHPEMKYPGLK